MRSTLNRSVSCALLFTFVFTQAAPALALRGLQASQQDDPRRKDTLEELTDALHRVGTQVAQAIGWPTPTPQPDPAQVAAGLEGITDFLKYLRLNNLELELGQAHAIYIRHERPEGDESNEGPIVLTDFERPEHLQRLGVGGLRLVDIDWDEGLVSLEGPSGETYRALQAALPPPAAGLEGWQGGPSIELRLRSTSRRQGPTLVVSQFNPSGDLVRVRLARVQKEGISLVVLPVDSEGDPAPERVAVVSRRDLRRVLGRPWREEASMRFEDSRFIEALRSGPVKVFLKARREDLLKRKRRGGIGVPPRRELSQNGFLVFFDTTSDDPSHWYPFAGVRVTPRADKHSAIFHFSGFRNVRFDRQGIYGTDRGALRVVVADRMDERKLGVQGEVFNVSGLKDSEKRRRIIELKPNVLIVRSKTTVDQGLIEALLPGLTDIYRAGHGTENIDVGHAEARGVRVRRTEGSEDSMAALTMRMVARAQARRSGSVPEADQAPASFLTIADWQKAVEKNMTGLDPNLSSRLREIASELFRPIGKDTLNALSGQRLGLIGFGTVGKRVAQVAQELGMRVMVHSPSLGKDPQPATSLRYEVATQEQIYRSAHYVVLVPRLYEAGPRRNVGMVDEAAVDQMLRNDDLIALVNPGRGRLVDEAAVRRLLQQRTTVAYLLDEVPQDPSLRTYALYTNHIGASTDQAEAQVLANTARLLRERASAGLEGQEEEEEGEQEEQPVQRMPAVKLEIAGWDAFIRKVTPSVASLQERREREGRQLIHTTWTDDLVAALAAVSTGTVDLLLISMSLRETPMPGLTRRVDDLPLVNDVLELVQQGQENRAQGHPPLPPLPIYLIQDPSADVPGRWEESLEQFQRKGWIQGIVLASVLQNSEAFDAFLEGVIPQVILAHEDFSQPPQAGTDHRPSQPSRPEMVSRVIDDGPPVESTEDSAATTPQRGYARRQATQQKIIQAIEGYEGEYLLTRKAMADLAGIDVRTLDRYPWRDMVKQENERRERKGQRLIRTNPRGRTRLRKAGTDRADDQAAGLEAAQAPSLEWNPRLIAHSPRPDFSPTQRAGVFGRILRIRGQIERFHRDFPDGIQFDAPRVAATGVLVDLTGSPAEAFASLYLRLPHDARVLVDSEVFGKILGLTDRLPDRDIRFFFKEEEETYAEALQRAIGSLAGVVRVFSTRSREAVLAAAGPHRGRVQTIESRDFRILLANLGALEDEALEAFLELLRELSGIRRLVEFL